MSQPGTNAASSSAATKALQFLLFEVAGKALALDLGLVDRVIEARPPLCTPRRPAYVDGVVEDRGRCVALFNLRTRFGLTAGGVLHPAIVLLRGLELDPLIGVTVDRVLQVLSVAPDAILAPPPRVFGIRSEFIHGVANLGGWPVVWLDMGKLLTASEPMTLLQ
jgi:purine-binding chemotaxis protein CheW